MLNSLTPQSQRLRAFAPSRLQFLLGPGMEAETPQRRQERGVVADSPTAQPGPPEFFRSFHE